MHGKIINTFHEQWRTHLSRYLLGVVAILAIVTTGLTSAIAGIGEQWEVVNPAPSPDELLAVLWNPDHSSGSQFVVVGGDGSGTILTSPDGISWTAVVPPMVNDLSDIASNGSLLVAVGDVGGVYTSPATSGTVWTTQPLAAQVELLSITWSGTQFVAVGVDGEIVTSPNGINWTTRASGAFPDLEYVIWDGSQFVVVGDLGIILTSPNGIVWTQQTSGTGLFLGSVSWNGSRLVAVGDSGTVITSPDGITWTPQTSGTTEILVGSTWTGTRFVVVGDNGVILTSPDGIAWTSRVSGTTNILGAVGSGAGQLIAVGDGTLVRSVTSSGRNNFDADNDSDVLVVRSDGLIATGLLENSVLQDFNALLFVNPAQGWTVNSTGDFNGDGASDLFLYNTTTGDYRIILMDGTSFISDTVVFSLNPAFGLEPRCVSDFDGDGRAEVLVHDPTSGYTALIFLTPTGAFSSLDAITLIDVANGWTLHDTSDFNGDGKTDLLTFNTTTGDTAITELDGASIIASTTAFGLPPASGWSIQETADFSGDGKDDILILHPTGVVGILPMDGPVIQSFYVPGLLLPASEIVNAGHYNTDNKADLLVFNTNNGDLMTVLMDGTLITSITNVLNLGLGTGWVYHRGKPFDSVLTVMPPS